MEDKKTLDDRFMDMTSGTYQAIQEIFNEKKLEKYPDAALLDKEKLKRINNHDFKTLCELYSHPDAEYSLRLDELIFLDVDPSSLQHLRDMGLLLFPENKEFKISPLGKTFMKYLEREIKDYLERDLSGYKRN